MPPHLQDKCGYLKDQVQQPEDLLDGNFLVLDR